MKKIYLFSVALMAFVMTSVGQNTCDPSLATVAWSYKYPAATDPHCQVIFNSNITGTGYQVALFNQDGVIIPRWNGADPWVDVLPDGSASIIYDCFAPGFVEVGYLNLKRVIIGQPLVDCHVPLTPAIITPVKLTSFTGRLQTDNSVILDWTSEIEWDSYKYEVQRSADGLHFESIGNLDASGNSVRAVKYTYNDQLPSTGAYFYRLKQIDFNGTFEYSKTVYVNSKKGAGVVTKVFPNPFKGDVQLIGATSSDLRPNNVSVHTISGQRIPYRIIGANAISIDPSAPDGIYILSIGSQHFRLVKSKSASTAF